MSAKNELWVLPRSFWPRSTLKWVSSPALGMFQDFHHCVWSDGKLFDAGKSGDFQRFWAGALDWVDPVGWVFFIEPLERDLWAINVFMGWRKLRKTDEFVSSVEFEEFGALLRWPSDKIDGEQGVKIPNWVQWAWKWETEREEGRTVEISLRVVEIRHFAEQNRGWKSAGIKFQKEGDWMWGKVKLREQYWNDLRKETSKSNRIGRKQDVEKWDLVAW